MNILKRKKVVHKVPPGSATAIFAFLFDENLSIFITDIRVITEKKHYVNKIISKLRLIKFITYKYKTN